VRRRRLAPVVALETSTFASGVGNGIVAVAFPWLVLERTGSATAAGLVAAAGAVPLVLSSLLSGTLVDLAGRRRTAIGADVLSGLSAAAVPLTDAVVGLDVATIALLAALGAVFDPAGFSAREAMLPECARAARMRLDRVNSVHTALFSVSFLVAPGVGGLLIAFVGAPATLYAATAAFAVSAAVVAFVRVSSAGRPDHHDAPTTFLAATREGVAVVFRTPLLRALAVVPAVALVAWFPVEAVMLPAFFVEQDAPQLLGALLAALSAGVVAGSLGYGLIAPRVSRHRVFVVTLALMAAAVLGLAQLPGYGAMLALGLAAGLFYGPVEPISNVTVQEMTPERLRGRVVGIMTSTAYAAGPLGLLLAGPVVDAFGVTTAFLGTAGLLVLLALGSALAPSLRRLDNPPLLEPEDLSRAE
jgi:MFS family permease